MYEAGDRVSELVRLWDQSEDILQELRYEVERAARQCAELTEERDEKGYQLLEAEERIEELEEEIHRLRESNRRRYHIRCHSKGLKQTENVKAQDNGSMEDCVI